ncbi:hypothetical protein ES703_125410 [subsurface metagenome]
MLYCATSVSGEDKVQLSWMLPPAMAVAVKPVGAGGPLPDAVAETSLVLVSMLPTASWALTT